MSWDTVVGDGVLAAGTLVTGIVTTRAARRTRRTIDNHEARVMPKLDRIEEQTDARLPERIKAAVEEVAREHPGMVSTAIATEAVTLLLEAIIQRNNDDDDDRPPWRPRRHDERD